MTVAAIDIGSNSVRLLISDDAGKSLHRESLVTGLARGVDRTGRLSDEAMSDTIEVIEDFAEAMRPHRFDSVRIVATSATRDASNGGQLMDQIEHIIGVRPEVIGGDAEAELSFVGATQSTDAPGPYLVIDIGGGSTEVVFGDVSIDWWQSFDIGSVRLTDRCLEERPSPPDQTARARDECDAIFESMPTFAPATVLGVAGSFTRVAALVGDLAEYDRNAVEGVTLTKGDFSSLIDRLAPLTLEETIALRAIDPKRAPVMLGGTIVGERVLAHAGVESVQVCTYGVLDGLVASMLS